MCRHVSEPRILFTSVHFAHATELLHFRVCPDMCRDILSSFTLPHFANFAHIVHFRICPDICPGGFLAFTLCTLVHFAHFRLWYTFTFPTCSEPQAAAHVTAQMPINLPGPTS